MPATGSGSQYPGDRNGEDLVRQVSSLEGQVRDLRRRLADGPGSHHTLELRLAETQRSLSALTAQNEKLAQTLRDLDGTLAVPGEVLWWVATAFMGAAVILTVTSGYEFFRDALAQRKTRSAA